MKNTKTNVQAEPQPPRDTRNETNAQSAVGSSVLFGDSLVNYNQISLSSNLEGARLVFWQGKDAVVRIPLNVEIAQAIYLPTMEYYKTQESKYMNQLRQHRENQHSKECI